MIILMGDFNAKVGKGHVDSNGVVGNFGFGHGNERGDRLVDFCWLNNLIITNTKFKQVQASQTMDMGSSQWKRPQSD